MTKRYAAAIPILALVLMLQGCPQNSPVNPPDPLQSYKDVANALNDISIAANAAVKAVLIVYPDNTSDRQQILGILAKVVQADNSGIAIVQGIVTLSPTDAQSLSKLLEPVFLEFHADVDSGLLGFKTPESKAKVQPYIDAIATAVTIIEAVLKARM